MLPAPPLQRRPPSLVGLQRLLSLLLSLLLLAPVLQACSSLPEPPRSLLLEALALQIRLTQEQVAEALQLQPVAPPLVSRVRLEQQQEVPIGDGRGLRLVGRFDWRLAEDPIRVDSPFEIYLLRGERGQTWRLARPVGAVGSEPMQAWISDPLPLKRDRAAPARAPASSASSASPASGADRLGSTPAAPG
ncbi:MAG: hypothetical protein VKJ44_04560 [Synechococcus sp.]|nr:hypothetical protein [Synechococcus sp.]